MNNVTKNVQVDKTIKIYGCGALTSSMKIRNEDWVPVYASPGPVDGQSPTLIATFTAPCLGILQ